MNNKYGSLFSSLNNDDENPHTKILKNINKNNKVLDIGCASGYIGEYLFENKNCEVHGVDYSQDDLDIAKKKNVYKTLHKINLNNLSTELDIYSNYFDKIILADVLEHLVEPEKLLEKITELLNENGEILISLPNISHGVIKYQLLKNNFNYTQTGLLDNTHLRFYTIKSFITLLNKLKLEIETIETVCKPTHMFIDQTIDTYQFPKEVREYIESDIESHIYQYILKIKKTSLSADKLENHNTKFIMAKQEDKTASKNFMDRNQNINEIENIINLGMQVFDIPEIIVDNKLRKPCVNIFIPALQNKDVSAGPLGILHLINLFKNNGFKVRILPIFEDDLNYEKSIERLSKIEGLENLFKDTEIHPIGNRKKEPLYISSKDISVATFWTSAYLAHAIQEKSDIKKFIYMIQDYEAAFYACSSHSIAANKTYDMDYHAMFSTEALQNYFLEKNIGNIVERKINYTYFNNASLHKLPPFENFIEQKTNQPKKRLVFYARPTARRNLYELGVNLLYQAIKKNMLNEAEWEFLAMGSSGINLKIGENSSLTSIEYMHVEDYRDFLSSCDIGLSLMASPHPSMPPMDLAGSGCVVLTNNFENKQQQYFDGISKNIISADPYVESMLIALKKCIDMSENLNQRYSNAKNINYPASWKDVWNENFQTWFKEIIELKN